MIPKIKPDDYAAMKSQGDLGEEMGYWFVKLILKYKHLTQFDFIANDENFFEAKLFAKNRRREWVVIEIKHKDPYIDKDFIGTGLNRYQAEIRNELYKDKQIRCALVIFEHILPNIYYQYLDVLEQNREVTKNGIYVYHYNHFKCISKEEFFELVKKEILKQRKSKINVKVSEKLCELLLIQNMSDFAKELQLQQIDEKKLLRERYQQFNNK